MDPRIELNDEAIHRKLQQLREFPVREGLRVFTAIGRFLKTSTQLRFRSQQAPNGQRWWPSARARRDGGQTLRDTNRLFRSITYRATNHSTEVGTNVAYAAAHHFGVRKIVNIRAHRRTTRRSHGERGAVSVKSAPVRAHMRLMFLPKREIFGFSPADRTGILDILARRLAEHAQK